jgi:ketosteroid isomerase-like protein
MSHENVEIVRSIYEAVNHRDWDAAFRDQRPDVELTTPPQGPNTGIYRGREECQGFWEDWFTAFESLSAEPEDLFESGDDVAVVVKIRARPKDSSAVIELRNGHLWAFRDGNALSVRVFPEPGKALEAAGLRE